METTTSEKQTEANRQNGRLGGVKTEEGKMKVRFNARKHGILSKVMSGSEEELYKSFVDQLFDEHQPIGFIEEMLTERIALYYVRLARVTKAEHEVVKDGNLGGGHIDAINQYFNRYETSVENRMIKVMHELERVQRRRQGETIEAPKAVDVNENGFVSQNGL